MANTPKTVHQSKNRRWNKVQIRCIEWLATPERLRDPATEDELAEELNRRPATLTRWRSLPGFQDAVDKAIRSRFLERKAEIFEVVRVKAEEGDFRYLKMALELIGVYPLPKPGAPERQPLKPYTAEEYAEAIEGVAQWRKETFGLNDDEARQMHP
jgi:hypothetical protein